LIFFILNNLKKIFLAVPTLSQICKKSKKIYMYMILSAKNEKLGKKLGKIRKN
jgi:hypothetical protein